ncbi:uncharacterized protein CTRU02_215440 [Colletotrichum truncatum]|uniref:Uncharacterized protein n=1 Tax=Colletotrichum truncatum TaxID=5467 RepID=A0ACC3YCG8_COLTU
MESSISTSLNCVRTRLGDFQAFPQLCMESEVDNTCLLIDTWQGKVVVSKTLLSSAQETSAKCSCDGLNELHDSQISPKLHLQSNIKPKSPDALEVCGRQSQQGLKMQAIQQGNKQLLYEPPSKPKSNDCNGTKGSASSAPPDLSLFLPIDHFPTRRRSHVGMPDEQNPADKVTNLRKLEDEKVLVRSSGLLHLENDLRAFTRQQLRTANESLQGLIETSYSESQW